MIETMFLAACYVWLAAQCFCWFGAGSPVWWSGRYADFLCLPPFAFMYDELPENPEIGMIAQLPDGEVFVCVRGGRWARLETELVGG